MDAALKYGQNFMMWSFRVGLFADSSIIVVLCIASSIVTHYYMFNGSALRDGALGHWLMIQWVWGSRVHCDKCALGILHDHAQIFFEK